ncbi:hypothetical protein [Paludibacterium yongneupense]|uniref:hypothetical protein n=1 Tax=Paludibacterium yongneupense TaxID=400061 RepID=UPI000418DF95|nr:hypothetical protein [Paludibacterium yongneupense]
MISFAILGLLQVLFLPGYLCARQFTRLECADKVLISVPLSLLLNYLTMFVLVNAGWYTQSVMLCIVMSEFVCLFAFRGSDFTSSVSKPVQNDRLASAALVLALIFLNCALAQDVGHVFEAWDTVASWNRWAMAWAEQRVISYWGYPQAVPAAYASIYVLAGSTNLQLVSKVVTQVMPYFGLLCLWRIGQIRPDYRRIACISGVLFALFQMQWYYSIAFIFSGYADPFSASMGVFAIYAFLLIGEIAVPARTQAREPVHWATLITIVLSVSAASVIKQPGLVATGLFCLALLCSHWPLFRQRIWLCLGLSSVLALIGLHWYAFTWERSLHHLDSFLYAGNMLIPSPYWLRPLTALREFSDIRLSALWALLLGVALAGRSDIRRLFVFFLLPQYLFWAVLVSYDLRSGYTFLPWVAMGAASGLVVLLDASRRHWLFRLPVWGLLIYLAVFALRYVDVTKHKGKTLLLTALVLVGWRMLSRRAPLRLGRRGALAGVLVLLLAPLLVPDGRLLDLNTRLRIQSNNMGFNQLLYDTMKNESHWMMGSDWQMPLNLPTFERRFTPCGCDVGAVLQYKIKYYIYASAFCKGSARQDIENALRRKHIDFTVKDLGQGYALLTKTSPPYGAAK